MPAWMESALEYEIRIGAARTPVHRRHFASVRVVNGKRDPPHWGDIGGNQRLSTMETRDTSLSFFSSRWLSLSRLGTDVVLRKEVSTVAEDRNNASETRDAEYTRCIHSRLITPRRQSPNLHETFRRDLWVRKADYTRPRWRLFHNRGFFYLLLKRAHCIEFRGALFILTRRRSRITRRISRDTFQFIAIQYRVWN